MNADASKLPLTDRHLAELRKSGLSDETIRAAGLRSVLEAEAKGMVGFDVGPALSFPYPGADSDGRPFVRLKPDTPFQGANGKGAKYVSPGKARNLAGNRLYVPATFERAALKDSNELILFTEGEKKTLKANQEGFPTVGLTGVYGWRRRAEDNESQTIEDLALIDFARRPVAIVFDSDAATNPKVQAAETRFKAELKRRSADAFIVRLPEPTPEEAQRFGGKLGLDDFLVSRGAEALQRLINAAHHQLPFGARSAATLLKEGIEPMRWLADGIWPEEGCGFVAGEPKTKKSWIALMLALCVISGKRFFGRSVAQGKVILFDEENLLPALQARVRRMALAMDVPETDLDDLIIAKKGELRLDVPAKLVELEELVERVKPKLLILDPLVRLHSCEENDSRAMSGILSPLRQLQIRQHCAVLIVHHLRKQNDQKVRAGQRLRGSSDLHGWLDSAIYCSFNKGDSDLEFECRYAASAPELTIRLEESGDLIWLKEIAKDDSEKESETPIRERVLAHILATKSPPSKSELTRKFRGVDLGSILAALESEGLVRRLTITTGGRSKEVFVPGTGPRNDPPETPPTTGASDPSGDTFLPTADPPNRGDGREGSKGGRDESMPTDPGGDRRTPDVTARGRSRAPTSPPTIVGGAPDQVTGRKNILPSTPTPLNGGGRKEGSLRDLERRSRRPSTSVEAEAERITRPLDLIAGLYVDHVPEDARTRAAWVHGQARYAGVDGRVVSDFCDAVFSTGDLGPIAMTRDQAAQTGVVFHAALRMELGWPPASWPPVEPARLPWLRDFMATTSDSEGTP